jgi:hypothetical protein
LVNKQHDDCPKRPPVELDGAHELQAVVPPVEKVSIAHAVQVIGGPVKPFDPYPDAHSLQTFPTFLKPISQTQVFKIGSKVE